jgi:periplasmic divalent cation tolerance protein
MLIVMTTVPDARSGEELASKLVDARLAACVQVLPAMMSVYVWEGDVHRETEHLLLIKTLPEKWPAVREFITANHSYDVPEIVAIKTEAVAEPYRKWLGEVVK